MSIKVVIKPLEPNIPGQAQMRIKNWGAEINNLEFKVQGNQDKGYLNGARGEWSNSEFWFTLSAVEQDSEGLLIAIGADLLDPLLENIGGAYIVTMRNSAGEEQQGRLKITGQLLPSTALGSSKAHQASGGLATPLAPPVQETIAEPELELALDSDALEIEPALVEVVAEPEPVIPAAQQLAPANKKGSGKIMLIVIVLLLLLIALAGAAWWFLQQKPALPGGSAVASSPVAASPAIEKESSAGVCALASMQKEDELIFIQNCLRESNDSNALLAVIQQAKANNHCGIAQRLYANRAQSGDAVIALAYAKEYDPQFFAANDCFKEANTETAVYWYETVLLNEPNNTEAAQRLEELVQ